MTTYIYYVTVLCVFVFCRSDDGSFYVVTCELIVKLFLCVWGVQRYNALHS